MSTTKKSAITKVKRFVLETIPNVVEQLIQHFATLLYRQIFKRNTIWPMMAIINAPTKERQIRLLRAWAQAKTNESSYIQLAGGLLFTTVSSCLQWPGTQSGHWSAAACFYSSILLSLVSIVAGSQQILVLPRQRGSSIILSNGLATSAMSPEQQRVTSTITPSTTSPESPSYGENNITYDEDDEELQYLEKVIEVMKIRLRDDRPNNLQVFALQTPLMLLSLAVVFFMAGLAAVVFGPLATNLAWDGNAKTAVTFGAVGVACIAVFFFTSQIMHAMFNRDDHAPWMGARIVRTPA